MTIFFILEQPFVNSFFTMTIFFILEQPLKVFYLNMNIVNSGSNVAVVSWVDLEGKPKQVEVGQGTHEERTVFTASVQPANVEVSAKDKETNQPLQLNKVEKFTVTPKETSEIVTINIGQGKGEFQYKAGFSLP